VEVLVAAAHPRHRRCGLERAAPAGVPGHGEGGQRKARASTWPRKIWRRRSAIGTGEEGFEDIEVSREPHALEIFGEIVSGTLVTVKRVCPGEGVGEVSYTYFVVDGDAD
jgi:hypothetical protein